jgi:Ca2+-binding RTX toxin-like protein
LGGNDTFFGSDGADEIDGGAGRDTFSFAFSKDGVSASLLRGRGWSGEAEDDRIKNVENLNGTLQDDFLWGDHNNNRLEGSFGNDTLVGNGGDDYILAGFGTDTVIFSGARAEYDISQMGIRTDITHRDGGVDGTDVIGHVEILRFADGDVLTADLLLL